jgi:tRNA-Thr(GGU) m(6)t(6)A37 methyltransferase TsaA
MSDDSGSFSFRPVGVVHCQDKRDNLSGLSHEERKNREATIEVFPEFAEGLGDIEGFSHIHILFVFHKSAESHLVSHPPCDDKSHGVFATRSPNRPNAIGLTVVKLIGKEDRILTIRGADMIDGTPVLDIKPYTRYDIKENIEEGWLKRALQNREK